MKRAVAFVTVAWFAALALALVSGPVSAAPDTLYFVNNVSCVDATSVWDNADCWSLTSGGAGGQGPPTSTDDVIYDALEGNGPQDNETGFAASVTLSLAGGGEFGTAGTLTIGGSLTFTEDVFTQVSIVGGITDGEVRYAGTISGTAAANNHVFGVDGDAFLIYTGTGDATASDVTMTEIDASAGPTIYCFPGCVDGGGNTNVVFAAPPVEPGPACGINESFPNLIPILFVVIGASLLILVVNFWLGMRSEKMDIKARVGLAVGTVIVIIIAAVLVSNLQCG